MDEKKSKKARALKLLEEIHRDVGPVSERELDEAIGEEDVPKDWRTGKAPSRRVG